VFEIFSVHKNLNYYRLMQKASVCPISVQGLGFRVWGFRVRV